MPRLAPKPVELDNEEKQELEKILARHSTSQQVAKRAKIILLASQGKNHRTIAKELDISRKMARLWRERWLELKLRPGRKRGENDPASWETIIGEQHDLFKSHPNTTFIAAHMGWYANNLGKLAELMEEMPNMYVGIGAIIAELGRQPKYARKFFIKYQDRILFGKDAWNPDEFPTYFRVLESDDEYFPYYKKYHAFWAMYGMNLPEEVLRKVYYKNALKLLPGIDKSLFPKD